MVIRVLLAELPSVLAEASERAIADAPDLELAGRSRADRAVDDVGRTGSDALILGSDQPLSPATTKGLLDVHPRVKVVCVSPDATAAALHERRHEVVAVADVGFDRMFSALRAACHSEADR